MPQVHSPELLLTLSPTLQLGNRFRPIRIRDESACRVSQPICRAFSFFFRLVIFNCSWHATGLPSDLPLLFFFSPPSAHYSISQPSSLNAVLPSLRFSCDSQHSTGKFQSTSTTSVLKTPWFPPVNLVSLYYNLRQSPSTGRLKSDLEFFSSSHQQKNLPPGLSPPYQRKPSRFVENLSMYSPCAKVSEYHLPLKLQTFRNASKPCSIHSRSCG